MSGIADDIAYYATVSITPATVWTSVALLPNVVSESTTHEFMKISSIKVSAPSYAETQLGFKNITAVQGTSFHGFVTDPLGAFVGSAITNRYNFLQLKGAFLKKTNQAVSRSLNIAAARRKNDLPEWVSTVSFAQYSESTMPTVHYRLEIGVISTTVDAASHTQGWVKVSGTVYFRDRKNY